MTVEQMLAVVSSTELAEWEAYERAFGPIGKSYGEQALASISDTLAILLRLYGEQFDDNPVPVPSKYPRPSEWYRPEAVEDSVDQAEFDRNFRD
ncbi:hypothetical protein [Rhodococcus phage REQ1]|uniref:hypothetical protein n=1 Tax=Rhodococcus phage REQ1 TaxID=1109712 RepID=UPI00023EEC6F|nr:hypothetical protein RoPhREQ1_gp77 [Rhodococcus phage REQ1]AEV52073.1 hypothetical protein [Rhodococcus phage REQ1]